MDNNFSSIIIICGVSTLFGIVFSILGIVMLKNKKKREKNCTAKTYGKVTDIIKHENYDHHSGYSSCLWHPVFEYNIGELKFVKESFYGSSQPKYAIGQNVEVYYNPENYNEYYIKGETLPKTLGTIFTIAGIVAIIIAAFSAILIF